MVMQVKQVQHYQLDLNGHTLASQLEGKTIVEFPVFLVLLADEVAKYKVIGKSKTAGSFLASLRTCALQAH